MITEQSNPNPPSAAVQPVLSRRFLYYQKDKSLRGRSLCLANFLENLKKQEEYRDFQTELIEAISSIREKGRKTPEIVREKVLQILKEFPSTLEEICEDAKIGKLEAEKILSELMKENVIVEKQQPHYMAMGEHFTLFYELVH